MSISPSNINPSHRFFSQENLIEEPEENTNIQKLEQTELETTSQLHTEIEHYLRVVGNFENLYQQRTLIDKKILDEYLLVAERLLHELRSTNPQSSLDILLSQAKILLWKSIQFGNIDIPKKKVVNIFEQINKLGESERPEFLLIKAEYEFQENSGFKTIQAILMIENQKANFYIGVINLCIQHFLTSKSPIWVLHANINMKYLEKLEPENHCMKLIKAELELFVAVSENPEIELKEIVPDQLTTPYTQYIRGWQCIYQKNYEKALMYFNLVKSETFATLDIEVAIKVAEARITIIESAYLLKAYHNQYQRPSPLTWGVLNKTMIHHNSYGEEFEIFDSTYTLSEIVKIAFSDKNYMKQFKLIYNSNFKVSENYEASIFKLKRMLTERNDSKEIITSTAELELIFSTLLSFCIDDFESIYSDMDFIRFLSKNSFKDFKLFSFMFSLIAHHLFEFEGDASSDGWGALENANRSSFGLFKPSWFYSNLNIISLLNQAELCIAANNIGEAERLVNKIEIDILPYQLHKKLIELQASIELKKENFQEVVNIINKISENLNEKYKRKSYIYFNHLLTKAYYQLENYKAVLKHSKPWKNLDRDEKIAYTLCNIAENKPAQELISKLVQKFPEDKEIFILDLHYRLYCSDQKPSISDGTKALLQTYLSTSPDITLRTLQATLLVRTCNQKNIKQGLKILYENLKINKDDIQTKLVICEAYLYSNNYSKTKNESWINQLSTIEPIFLRNYHNTLLGMIYCINHQVELATEVYKNVRRLGSQKLSAFSNSVRAMLKFEKGDFDEAKSLAKQSLWKLNYKYEPKLAKEVLFKIHDASLLSYINNILVLNVNYLDEMTEIANFFKNKFYDDSFNNHIKEKVNITTEYNKIVSSSNLINIMDLDYNVILHITFNNANLLLKLTVPNNISLTNLTFFKKLDAALKTIEIKYNSYNDSDKLKVENSYNTIKSCLYYLKSDSINCLNFLKRLLLNNPTHILLRGLEIHCLIINQQYSTALKLINKYINYSLQDQSLLISKSIIAFCSDDHKLKAECFNHKNANFIVKSLSSSASSLAQEPFLEEQLEKFIKNSESFLDPFMLTVFKLSDVNLLILKKCYKSAIEKFKSINCHSSCEIVYNRIRNEIKISLPIELAHGLALERGNSYSEVENGTLDVATDVSLDDVITEFEAIPNSYFEKNKRKNKKTKAELLSALKLFISFLKSDDPLYNARYVGVPVDLDKRKVYYQQLKVFLTQTISIYRALGDPDRIPDFLISFTYDAAPPVWCAAQGSRELKANYENAAGTKKDLTLNDYIYNDLDRLKVQLLIEIANEDAKANNHQQSSHLISEYVRWLDESYTASIPLLDYDDPYKYPTSHNPQSLEVRFIKEFNFLRIINYLHLQIQNSPERALLYYSKLQEIMEIKLISKNTIQIFEKINHFVILKIERAKQSPENTSDIQNYLMLSLEIHSIVSFLNSHLSVPLRHQLITDFETARNKMRDEIEAYRETGFNGDELSIDKLIELSVAELTQNKGTAIKLLKINYLDKVLEDKSYTVVDDEGNSNITPLGVRTILTDVGILHEIRKGKRKNPQTKDSLSKSRKTTS